MNDEGTERKPVVCLCGQREGEEFHREKCAMNGQPQEYGDAWTISMLEAITESIETGGAR